MNFIKPNNFYVRGPWAVIDAFSGRVWINLQDKDMATIVKRTFSYKTNAEIVDISRAENYQEQLVDNTVCLNWFIKVQNEPARYSLPNFQSLEFVPDSPSVSVYLENRNQETPCPIIADIHLQICSFLALSTSYFGRIDQSLIEPIARIYSVEKSISEIGKKLTELCHDEMKKHPLSCLRILGALGKLYD